MTNLEIRAMLKRADPRQLRQDAGISPRTVQQALGLTRHQLSAWERREHPPVCEAGIRWARVIAGLERHAQVSAEIAAAESEAA